MIKKTMNTALRINKTRLQERMDEIAQIGRTDKGGVTRVTLTDEDKEARNLLIQWFAESDCEIHVDPIGNVFAVYPGEDRSLAPVLTGSHNDSQPLGGRFDGILGIMAGLEVVTTLHENKVKLQRDFVVVNWTNEEGSRFTPGCTGSGVWAGKLDLEEMYALQDREGRSLGDELERIGFKGTSTYHPMPLHAAFELHVEQGPILERNETTIGIPEGIVCLRWYDIDIIGEPNHVGPTPMNARKDALYLFALMNQQVHDIASSKEALVASIGEVQATPNARNVIAGHVHFTVDLRCWDESLADVTCGEIEAKFNEIAEEHGCQVNIKRTWYESRAIFNRELVDVIKEASNELDFSHLEMVSGASHDMIFVNQVAPGAMIFVPSMRGESHSEFEETSWEDCAAGTDVLLKCVMKTANDDVAVEY